MSDSGYLGNANLKRVGEVISYTEEQALELAKCMEDPIYFIKNYMKIVNVDHGLVPFTMWPFQEDMVGTFHNNRFAIAKMPRQVGKTTTAAGYMLWSVLFQENYNVAILANKGSLAREILDRIKYAYEYLPKWLQQGIQVWNKGNIELENGSKIFAYATSASGVRGGSYNLIFLDEFAFVPHNMAQEFFTATYPVISSGKTTKVIIVSTPNGLNQFYKMWTDAIEGRSTYKPVEVHWSMVPGRDEAWKEETIRNTSEEQFRQEFETEFIGSSATLISGVKLRNLTFMDPISVVDKFYMYEKPLEGHSYVLAVDSAEGVMLDYSSFSVVDVTSIPYRQVGVFRDNTLPLLIYPTMIYHYAKMYNEAFVLIETNNIGQQVVDSLHYDLEYENIYKLEYHNIKGQNISSGFKRSISLGLKTTKSVKKIGCANLKTLVENDKLLINDFNTIAELNTFARNKDSYEAEEGNHDDLVMTLVMFSWLTTQAFFKENTNTDIRRRLVEEQNLMYEEDMTPFGLYDDGVKEEPTLEAGDLWSTYRDRGYSSSNF
jgi:hypothetical protein